MFIAESNDDGSGAGFIEVFGPCDDDEGWVDMDEWTASHPIISTDGVATCILLAAFNRITHQGLLGHFSTVSRDIDRILSPHNETFPGPDAFEVALAHVPKLGAIQDTELVLGGACISYEGQVQADVVLARAYTLGQIACLCIPEDKIQVAWNENPDTCLDALLDCRGDGVLFIERHPSIPWTKLVPTSVE